jgi:hypothetical protein
MTISRKCFPPACTQHRPLSDANHVAQIPNSRHQGAIARGPTRSRPRAERTSAFSCARGNQRKGSQSVRCGLVRRGGAARATQPRLVSPVARCRRRQRTRSRPPARLYIRHCPGCRFLPHPPSQLTATQVPYKSEALPSQLSSQHRRRRMGKGRAPCCAKVGLNRGSWTPEEDMRLIAYIQKYGHANWRALPKQAGTCFAASDRGPLHIHMQYICRY